MRTYAVVVAAGSGARLPGAVSKQFLPFAGEPMYARSLRSIDRAARIAGTVLVVPESEVAAVERAAAALAPPLSKPLSIVPGGARRQDSVLAGALAAPECDLLVIHDAARPLAPAALFDAVANAAEAAGCAAIPVLPVADTVKEVGAGGDPVRTLDRSRLVLSQTPQAFPRDALIRALRDAAAGGTEVTDEASLFEKGAFGVSAVPGDARNIKITHPADLTLARALAGGAADDLRIGSGEDVHPFADGRPLVLGGVTIPGVRGLGGHSDADAPLHALIDAIAGAASLPSIGEMFPDTDPRWKGASSLGMLTEAARRARDAGWGLVNADIVVLCDQPRLLPHTEAMRRAIAEALGCEPSRIGLRGKSPEGLGPEGRGEGISARAVVLMRRGSAP